MARRNFLAPWSLAEREDRTAGRLFRIRRLGLGLLGLKSEVRITVLCMYAPAKLKLLEPFQWISSCPGSYSWYKSSRFELNSRGQTWFDERIISRPSSSLGCSSPPSSCVPVIKEGSSNLPSAPPSISYRPPCSSSFLFPSLLASSSCFLVSSASSSVLGWRYGIDSSGVLLFLLSSFTVAVARRKWF